jgi:hypothetical protein
MALKSSLKIMGLLDIIYQIFRDYSTAVENEERQKILAEKAFKQTFALFYYDWITHRNAGVHYPAFTSYTNEILQRYANVMLQILTELGGSLSTVQKNHLLEFITEFRKISNKLEISESGEIVAQINERAEKAKELFGDV